MDDIKPLGGSSFSPVVTAGFWMLGALSSLVVVTISVRELTRDLDVFQVIFLRSAITLLLLVPILSVSGWHQTRPGNLTMQVGRNLTQFAGVFCWMVGIANIPLAEVVALEFTTPLWSLLMAVLLLKEDINRYRLFALMMGIVGVLLVTRPGFASIHPAALVVILGAVSFALSHILTRKLMLMQASAMSIVIYMTLVHLIVSLLPAVKNWHTPEIWHWYWLLAMALTSITAHFSFAKAFARADAMIVIPMDFLRLPLVALAGYVLYQENVDLAVIVGAVLMFGGNLVSIRAEKQRVDQLAEQS